MKKKSLSFIFAICLIISAVFMLSACGKKEDAKYYITFMVNGAEYKTYQTTQKDDILNMMMPTKEGYSFNGWYSDAECKHRLCDNTRSDLEWLIGNCERAGDLTVYAGFKVNSYVIQFQTYGEEAIRTIIADYNETIIEPEAHTRAGYVFDGWFKDANLTERFIFNKMPAQNLTLYPKYLACFNVNSSGQITGVTTAGRNAENIIIPESFNGITITSIGEEAFGGCEELKTITLNNKIVSIGNYAFAVCKNLQTIDIPNSVTSIGEGAFGRCTNLQSATIGNGLSTIPYGCFYQCSKLTAVTLGEKVENIGDIAFSTSGLTSIDLTGVETLGIGAFENSKLVNVTITGTISAIPDDCFANCSQIDSVVILNGVTSIGTRAFNYSNLNEITIPNSVTSIAEMAFRGCENLEEIVLPENLEEIKTKTFYMCSNLKSVILPTNLKRIQTQSFYKCASLKTIYIPSSVISISAKEDESYDPYYAPFYGCDMTIYCGDSHTNYGMYWDAKSTNRSNTVIWDTTYEEYLEIISNQ